MSVFFNLHFLQNLIYPSLEISSKVVQILDILFFIKRWFTKFAQKSHVFWKFTKIVWWFFCSKNCKNCMIYIWNCTIKNWTIFFHKQEIKYNLGSNGSVISDRFYIIYYCIETILDQEQYLDITFHGCFF